MNIDLATIAKGTAITVTLADGSTIAGTFVSVNSKGINVTTADGKLVSRAVSRIDRVDVYGADTTPDTPADLFTDEGTYGAADIAAALDMDAYDLRVWLRDRGYGVGKGRKYGFDRGDANGVVRAYRANPELINTPAARAAAADTDA